MHGSQASTSSTMSLILSLARCMLSVMAWVLCYSLQGRKLNHALGMGDPVVLIECAERRQLSYFPIRKDALLVPVQKFGAALD